MRQQRGLIVLVLLTAAALVVGLVFVSRDGPSAASGQAVPGAEAATTVASPEAPARADAGEAPTGGTGLVYGEGARSITVPISAPSYIAIDADTGRVLIAHRDRQKRPVASLTKMMTALLVAEAGDLGRVVEVPYVATQVEPNMEGLAVGERVTRRTLLWSTMLASANDSATALAYDASGGSLVRFFRRMNARAHELGMTDTRYRSASGLNDEGNWSSARDQAVVARALLHDPLLAKIVSTRRKQLAGLAPGDSRQWVNHNQLLGRYPGALGVKTGFTTAAGNCLAAAARRGGKEVIAVVLGSQSIYYDMPILLDRAFELLGVEAPSQPAAQAA